MCGKVFKQSINKVLLKRSLTRFIRTFAVCKDNKQSRNYEKD